MVTTSDDAELKSSAITARVTDTFSKAFAAKAAEVPGRTSAELARRVLESFMYEEPVHVKLLKEIWALRYIVLNGLPALAADPDAAKAAILVIKTDADKKKADRARTILQGTR